MSCITITTFSLSVNGDSFRYFKGKKELRQGDQVSPLLFVLVMEYLNRILKKMSSRTEFDFDHRCAPVKLTHLAFGLYANKEKSTMYFGNVSEEIQQRILQI